MARVAEEFQRDPGRILKAAASCNSQRGPSNSKGPVASRVQRNILGLSGIFTVPDRGWPLSNVKQPATTSVQNCVLHPKSNPGEINWLS